MELRDILFEIEDGVARITLNKPDKLNALSWSSWAEIETVIEACNADDAVRCVLITGAGRGFCSGTDLTVTSGDSSPRPYEGRAGVLRSVHLGAATVYDCRKPTIAAVNGVCVGAGLSIALACDIRIASEAASFCAIFTRRGLSADTGSTWFLPRMIGMDRALEMLYTGRMVEAEEAGHMGLVGEVLPVDAFMSRAQSLAGEIAHGPTLAIELNKRLARDGLQRTLTEQIEAEEYHQDITQKSEDAVEGRQSFLEKRAADFKGR